MSVSRRKADEAEWIHSSQSILIERHSRLQFVPANYNCAN